MSGKRGSQCRETKYRERWKGERSAPRPPSPPATQSHARPREPGQGLGWQVTYRTGRTRDSMSDPSQGRPLTSPVRMRRDGPRSADSKVPAGDFLALIKTSRDSDSGRFRKVPVTLRAGPGIPALTFALISWLLKLLCVKRAIPKE